jgi:glycosyltransferase involved in cell wall biosynthesis
MRILFSTDQIYLHGGIEKVMAEKANYFADVLGYEVFILTTEQKGKLPCYALSTKIKLIDLEVNYVRNISYFHPLNLKKIPAHFSRFKKKIKEIKPDFIISCNYAFDFYWLPFTFKTIPKLKEFHSSRFYENEARKKLNGVRKLKYVLNDFIESKFTKLVLLNPDELAFYSSLNKIVIPNPIQIVPISNKPLREKRAIAAGRIAPVKGFDAMIKAWQKVDELCPEWQLVIFGNGEKEYIAYLNNLIIKLNLQHKVIIHSATNQLRSEFLTASFYLMTSKTECYPMVLLEAMNAGLPVITYDSPTGPRHIVTSNLDGIIVEYQNELRLVEKIVFLMQNDKFLNEMRENAINKSQSFSVDKIMIQWEILFKQLRHQN